MDPVPIRFVAPTLTVTVEPALNPDSSQNVSVAFTNVQDRFTEYPVIADPPSSTGARTDRRSGLLGASCSGSWVREEPHPIM